MGSSEGQTYCLRWNNHKSNLVEILDALIKMECYVDCTIYVDEQVQFKAHRVVLAANSPYFQSILQDVPMDHCSILFPGVQEFEMRALLEYMYTGEVNVTQAQIPRIMKIAEQLEVKGLFDMADMKGRFNKMVDERERDSTAVAVASNNNYSSKSAPLPPSASLQLSSVNHQSPPVISTSTNISIAQSSSASPPYTYKSPYSSLYSRSPGAIERDRDRDRERERDRDRDRDRDREERRERSASFSHPSQIQSSSSTQSQLYPSQPQPQTSTQSSTAPAWTVPPQIPVTLGQPQLHSMLSSVYDSSTDMNPLKRKKLQSMSSMLRDTPILRNVLAQTTVADSSQTSTATLSLQPIQNLKPETERPGSHHSNGSGYKQPLKEPHSPYADKSFDDDLLDSPHNYSGDARLASYVPHQQQKPEWKRYKQYTRTDILNAIECVRKGMSALQASRKFGVPSRTLYDKVKKLGITTGRPMNRTLKRSPSSGSSPAPFPYGLSGTSHMFSGGGGSHSDQQLPSQSQQLDEDGGHEGSTRGMIKIEHGSHHLPPTIPHPAAALLDPSFLQQALEARGGDIAGREALHAMAFAAAAHAAVNGISTSPGTHGTARSPSPNVLMKYMRSVSMSSPEEDHPGREPAGEHSAPHHHNGSETGYGRHLQQQQQSPQQQEQSQQPHQEPIEHDPEDDEDDGHRSSLAGHHDDLVEDLSMGPKRDSVERGPSASPSLPPQSDVSLAIRPPPSPPVHLSQPPHPPPLPPPQQQGVIVPTPGKLKEDYAITIKRELIADSNAPSDSS